MANKTSTNIETIPNEPYVKLLTARDFENWDKEDEIAYNQQLRQKEKIYFYQQAFDFLYDHSIKGDYYEFGCHKGRTFRMVLSEARKKNFSNMNFYAFDSFEGLPDLGKKNLMHKNFYSPKALKTTEHIFMEIIREHGLFTDRVFTVKGYYQDVLNEKLVNDFKRKNSVASLITFDCNLDDSYRCALKFSENFFQEGTVLYLDDYRGAYKGNPEKGIQKVFEEFRKKSKFKFDEFLNIGWFGKSFIVYK